MPELPRDLTVKVSVNSAEIGNLESLCAAVRDAASAWFRRNRKVHL